MSEERNWLSCREAATMLNYTQRHITNLIIKGKIKASKDGNGKYYILKSEFFSCYPNAARSDMTRRDKMKISENTTMHLLQEKINHLEKLIEEKNKRMNFLTDQLNRYYDERSKMLDALIINIKS